MDAQKTTLADERAVSKAEQYRRRKVTSVLAIVFTDIANSTQIREELGEVAYESIREEYDENFTNIVETDDSGAVVKSTGDGALVVFSEPSQAVERCLQVQRELGSHQYFKLRIGIDMGQVSVKSAHGIVRDVFGRHVNRAARIQALAVPGHILTSFHIFDCAVGWLRGSNISWHNHGEASVKGFAGPISVHEVYDPLYCTCQSNKHFPVYQPPLYSTRDANDRPVQLDKQGWDDLYKALRNKPIKVIPPSSTFSEAPFSHYTQKLRSRVTELLSLLPETPSILWVDDSPENNSREHRVLRDAGCVLDVAISTEEAKDRITEERYFLVITDMRRGENSTAGLDLVKWCKKRKIITPIFVYASNKTIALYGDQAREEGASLCTSGVITLLDGINQILLGFLYRVPREQLDQNEYGHPYRLETGGLFGKLKRLFRPK
jgi:class 3 adenylate cyclase/CheY-like chemotaxis protein